MNILAILAGLAAGGILGFLFFAGLWLTIRKCLNSRHPGIWFAASLILRLSTVVLGLLLVARHNWQSLVSALIGFLAVRSFMTGRIKHQLEQIQTEKEVAGDADQS